MPATIPTTILRENLADVLNEVAKKRHYFLVTKKNKPVSALVNLDFFEDLLALNSPQYLKSVQEARRQYQKGETFSFQEVFGQL